MFVLPWRPVGGIALAWVASRLFGVTMAEQGVPMDVTGWWAAMVPAGAPKEALDQINKWFVQVVGSDETKRFRFIETERGGSGVMMARRTAEAATTSAPIPDPARARRHPDRLGCDRRGVEEDRRDL